MTKQHYSLVYVIHENVVSNLTEDLVNSKIEHKSVYDRITFNYTRVLLGFETNEDKILAKLILSKYDDFTFEYFNGLKGDHNEI